MFSSFVSLINKNLFNASRQKFLLRKRKLTSKKQKVAQKKFLQEQPNGSYTHELKILQIQKQLDRKVSRNHHLNQLMDELFYPDIRYANQKLVEQNLLKMSSNPPQKNQQNKKPKTQQNQQLNPKQYQQYDQVIQQIYLSQIPTQLFQLYLKNSQIITHQHLIVYFNRLRSYFKNRTKIQERILRKWKQSLDKLKLTDTQKKKRKRCPYVFLEQEELIRDQQWIKVVKDIAKKIQTTTQLISNQTSQNTQNQQINQQSLQTIDESYFSIQNNCDLILLIQAATGYIPEQIFSSIVKKMLSIVKLNIKEKNSQQKLSIFTLQQKVKLLRVLTLKNKTKSSLTKAVLIESPEDSKNQTQMITSIGRKMCLDIIASNQSNAEDIGAIFRSGKGYYKFINSMILENAKNKITKFLSSTNLQRSIDYLYAYWLNGNTKDRQFLQILKFDIYRKLPYSFSKHYLFFLLSFIKNSRIYFRGSELSIPVSQIFPRIAQTLTKYVNRGQLNHEQIKTFVNSIYKNYPLYKVEEKINVLEMISTAIVKIGQGYKLEEITELMFKINLLGHRSRIFCRYVFERYRKQYKKQLSQYKNTRVHLITDRRFQKDNKQTNQQQNLPTLNEIILQQSLIMMIWSFITTYKQLNVQLPLNDMLEIYPLNVPTSDEMIMDLIEDVNTELEQFNLFPVISNQLPNDQKSVRSTKRPSFDNQQQIRNNKRNLLLLKTNTSSKYQYNYNLQVCKQIINYIQANGEHINKSNFSTLTDLLIRYFIISSNKKQNLPIAKLPNRWNDCVKNIISRNSIMYQQSVLGFHRIKQGDFQNQEIVRMYRKVKTIFQKQNSTGQNGKLKVGLSFESQKKVSKPYQML